MKVAIVTEDGHSVSQHFGRAPYYAVLTVERETIVARELRPKAAPHLAGGHDAHVASAPHGTDPVSQARHNQMAAVVADCAVLVVGGMGRGAYERVAALGLRPIVTEVTEIDEAALACARGSLVDHLERLHHEEGHS
ncbi:MAG: NifB/NifX family molybdenum-iron cluster-binding protein [Candidatus Limnocylindrales bacterium]